LLLVLTVLLRSSGELCSAANNADLQVKGLSYMPAFRYFSVAMETFAQSSVDSLNVFR
jgi:hypothetical protein